MKVSTQEKGGYVFEVPDETAQQAIDSGLLHAVPDDAPLGPTEEKAEPTVQSKSRKTR